jgi:K+-transporting ATPase ATPase C chain
MGTLLAELKTSLIMTAALAVILCGLYPLAVFATAQAFFPKKAAGSLLRSGAEIIGSQLLAQPFTGSQYFHPRPSAAGDGYDASASGGSNLGPISKKLIDTVKERVEQYRAENGLRPDAEAPADAVTASGSGLDPHISVANALLQAPRVAKARGSSEDAVKEEIRRNTEGRDLGILGQPRVNVLLLNLALDKAADDDKGLQPLVFDAEKQE